MSLLCSSPLQSHPYCSSLIDSLSTSRIFKIMATASKRLLLCRPSFASPLLRSHLLRPLLDGSPGSLHLSLRQVLEELVKVLLPLLPILPRQTLCCAGNRCKRDTRKFSWRIPAAGFACPSPDAPDSTPALWVAYQEIAQAVQAFHYNP